MITDAHSTAVLARLAICMRMPFNTSTQHWKVRSSESVIKCHKMPQDMHCCVASGFQGALRACSAPKAWRAALGLLDEMATHRVIPSLRSRHPRQLSYTVVLRDHPDAKFRCEEKTYTNVVGPPGESLPTVHSHLPLLQHICFLRSYFCN